MKTTKEKFEELLSILKLNYIVRYYKDNTATISTCIPNADTTDRYLTLKLDGNVITVYTGEEVSHVLYLSDEMSVGCRVLDIENILIRYANLKCGPIALTLYLYYTLLGMLWGIKASNWIKGQDPISNNSARIKLFGHKSDIAYMYDFRACMDGKIRITKYTDKISNKEDYAFHPIEYVQDPEGIIQKIFSFFNVDSIDSVEKE